MFGYFLCDKRKVDSLPAATSSTANAKTLPRRSRTE